MRVFFDKDCDVTLLKDTCVAVVGYGSQGHAQAANLRDSGAGRVIVALPEASQSRPRAVAAGFEVMTVAEAALVADMVVMLAPDETQAKIYSQSLAQHMRGGASLVFAHGLNIQFELIGPREDLDVFLVSPKGPGQQLRAQYLAGAGLPCLIAVHQDASGKARQHALAFAAALGGGRAGILETSFKEECETDLFGEQAVLCGGVVDLINAGFETLVEAGYEPEMAYFECLHEVKLITDLIYERGIAGMRDAISNTAEFGGYKAGPRVIGEESRAAMKAILADIQSGAFVRDFVEDTEAGGPYMEAERERTRSLRVEKVGKRLRALMPFLGGGETS